MAQPVLTYNAVKAQKTGHYVKKKLSPKQWIAAAVLIVLFSLLTLFAYYISHEDSRFEKFARSIFVEELASNPINLHYTLENADAYNIDEDKLTLPVYQPGQMEIQHEKLEETLRTLRSFHSEKLSPQNQYTYVLLSSYLQTAAECASYPYYEEPLSPFSGIQSGLPLLLAEYRLRNIADIKRYLTILAQIPDYLEGIARYEQEKADRGFFMSDSSADKVIEQCTELMDLSQLRNGSHFLELTFASRLQELVEKELITQTEADAWQSENHRLLTTVVAPAYEKLADTLTLLKGNVSKTMGLAHYPDGAEYYLSYLRLSTGSYREISRIKEMLSQDFKQNYTELATLLQNDTGLRNIIDKEDTFFPALTAEEILNNLKDSSALNYPAIPFVKGESASHTVKYVDASLELYTAPAFYLIPPIDNPRSNTIYINRKDTEDGLSLYSTLAHEGYPGHLYQTLYSSYYLREIGACPLRNIMYYGGYVEGWAMYAELNAYDDAAPLTEEHCDKAKTLYQAIKLNRQIQLALYCLLDIAIHYEGASYESVCQMLSAIGFTQNEVMQSVYEYIVMEPANYLKYYLGYLEILELKKQAKTAWGDNYTDYDFHTFFLKNGPADYRTLSRLLTLYGSSPQSLRLERKN